MINKKFEKVVELSKQEPLMKVKTFRVDTRYNIVSTICYFNNKLWKQYGNKFHPSGMRVSRLGKYIVFTL